MTCHSFNCFSTVRGQGKAPLVTSLPSSCYMTFMLLKLIRTPIVPPLTQALLIFKCPGNEATSSPGSSLHPPLGRDKTKIKKSLSFSWAISLEIQPTEKLLLRGNFILNCYSPLSLEPSKLVHSCALWRNRTHCQEWFVWWSPVLCFLRRCTRRWLCFLLRKSHHQLAHERK